VVGNVLWCQRHRAILSVDVIALPDLVLSIWRVCRISVYGKGVTPDVGRPVRRAEHTHCAAVVTRRSYAESR
jgi:hypothetical protein